MIQRRFAATTALSLLAASLLAACSALFEPAPTSPAEDFLNQPADLKRGRQLFTGSCGGYCHPTKPGNRDSPYLFDCNWKNGGSDGEVFVSISSGIPGTRMPRWGGKLPERDQDIWRLIAYIRSKETCKAN